MFLLSNVQLKIISLNNNNLFEELNTYKKKRGE